jgi:hypothetical protein
MLIKEPMMKFASFVTALLCSSFALAQSVIGSFTFIKETDPLNDEDRSLIWTAETRDRERAGQLQFRCQQNNRTKQTDLYVTLKHGLNDFSFRENSTWLGLQYRLDSQRASSEWRSYFSEDRTRIYFADDARKALVKDAQTAQKAVLVLTSDVLAPQTYVFNLQELSAALRKLKCRVQN